MELCTVLLTLCLILISLLIWKCIKNYGTLEAAGIPTIKPFLFFGSPPFALHKIKWTDWYVEQHKKYGKTFGQYIGSYALITTIDPEIIKSIYVKNFEEFGDMVDNPHYEDKMKTIDLAQAEEWKELRKIMSPTFTTGKIKTMLEPMMGVVEKAMSHLETSNNKDRIEMKKFFQGFALDIICRCAFSIETNAHSNENDHLVKAGREAFQGFTVNSWPESIFTLLFYLFPGLESTFPSIIYPEAFFKLQDIMDKIVDERISSKAHHGDFIDRIIEVSNDPKAKVTKDMIRAQGKIFFAAGFETTSNCLTTLCYNLALNPAIQNKIREEVSSLDKIDHDSIQDLPYLTAAINENLRMYPPVIVQDRICKKDAEIKGIKIKKGTYVRVPIFACHHHPDHFDEPDQFKPERFLDNKLEQYTFNAFSGGPRICLGMRFAMTEMKLCMAAILKRFEIKTCPETKLELNCGDQFIFNYKEVVLSLKDI